MLQMPEAHTDFSHLWALLINEKFSVEIKDCCLVGLCDHESSLANYNWSKLEQDATKLN